MKNKYISSLILSIVAFFVFFGLASYVSAVDMGNYNINYSGITFFEIVETDSNFV